MSSALLSEDLHIAIEEALNDVVFLLTGEAITVDVAIVRLESIIETINSITEHLLVPWSVRMVSLLEEAVIELTFPEGQAAPEVRPVGRPTIQIPLQSIENLLAMNFSVPAIGKMFSVSKDTIIRRMKENGLSIGGTYTIISDLEFHQLVVEILTNFPNTGYKRMKGFLLSRGVKVTEYRVREAMRLLDPNGVYQRTSQNRAINRRQYYVEYSNQLWHLDTNLKLIRWNIVVRSCIDGKSRTVVYLDASGDNRADTNLHSFMSAVGIYGTPLHTRSDKGGENVLIAKFMIEARGTGRASHICGRSVHNQRIERLWRDVFNGCTGTYYAMFSKLEEDGFLNLDDSRHVYLLHRIFFPRLNAHLADFMDSWNWHPISTEGNKSPRQLMGLHLPPSAFDLELSADHLPTLEFVCNELADLERFSQEEGITSPVAANVNLSPADESAINSINVLRDSASYGYDIFVDAINRLHWAPND